MFIEGRQIMTTTFTTQSTTKSATHTDKMDKTFDFSSFLAKERKMSDKPEVSETNTIKDESFKKGLLKTIIMAGNGVFEVVDSKYGFSVKNQGGNYPGLGSAYDSLATGCFVTENPAPKLPRKAIETVIEWYKRITLKNGEEAQVNFYWNQYKKETVKNDAGEDVVIKDIPGVHYWTEDLFSYTPKQYNHGSLTEVADEDEWYDVFNRNFGMYVETHSHNSMDAFASGTDEANSANDGFQLVFGHLNTETPIMYSWMTMNRVMRLGMTEEELGKIMEFNPTCRYDLSQEKLVYQVKDLDYDESLFEVWDAQVIQRPARTTYTTHYEGTSYYDGYEARDYTKPVGYTSYAHSRSRTRSDYTVYTRPEERQAVEEAFDKTFDASVIHQILRGQNESIEYNKVCEMLRSAFVAGYMSKKDGPYSVNNFTMPKLEESVDLQASGILEEFYELSE